MCIREYINCGDRIAMIRTGIFNSHKHSSLYHLESKAELITSKRETLITS